VTLDIYAHEFEEPEVEMTSLTSSAQRFRACSSSNLSKSDKKGPTTHGALIGYGSNGLVEPWSVPGSNR
jgi:hypothetical protein